MKVDWPDRLNHIHNCAYLLPKYSQLIYWLVTGKIVTGLTLNRGGKDGSCIFCTVANTAKHMFWDCPATQDFWGRVNEMGHSFWPAYTDFDYLDIPSLTAKYCPANLMKVSALWAMWLQWNDLFYNREEFNNDRDWLNETMMRLKVELLLRMREAKPVIQWLTIIAERRLCPTGPDGPGEQHAGRASEKRFLLTDALSINTNPRICLPDEDCADTAKLLGNNVLIYRRANKIVFNHALWHEYAQHQNEPEYGSDSSEAQDSDGVDIGGAAYLIREY